LSLSEYDFDVIHRAGKRHQNADALSRVAINAVVEGEYFEPIWDRDTILQEQRKDPALSEIFQHLQQHPEDDDEYSVDDDGLLFRNRVSGEVDDKLVVPAAMTAKIMRIYHCLPTSGHLGFDKTYVKINKLFFWKGMYADIKKFCKDCVSCVSRKTNPHTKPAPIQRFPPVTKVFERTSMDVVGPLPTTKNGNKYILTFIDYFSKYAEAIPLSNVSAETVARAFIVNIVTRHGVPNALLTDCGTNFTSKLFKDVCKYLGIQKLQTTPYRPECNGTIERMHRSLKDMLSHYVTDLQDNWDDMLPYVMMAYRSTMHSSTQQTPFYLLHGREMQLPFDDIITPRRVRYDLDDNYASELAQRLHVVFTNVQDQLKLAAERQERQQHPKSSSVKIKVGDTVFLHNKSVKPGLTKAFRKPWVGPYKVLEQLGPVNFKICKVNGKKVINVHSNRLKLYTVADETNSSGSAGMTDNECADVDIADDQYQHILNTIKGTNDNNDVTPPPSPYQTRSRGPVPSSPWVLNRPLEWRRN
jgi:transposase InsO family protein